MNQRANASVEGEANPPQRAGSLGAPAWALPMKGATRAPVIPAPVINGFTFVGMLVAVSILSILAGSIYTLVVSLHQGYNNQVAMANMQQEARVALSVFSNEIQMAGFDPSGNFFQNTPNVNVYAPLFKKPKDCSAGKKDLETGSIMEASETVFHLMKNEDPNDPNEGIRYEWVGANGRSVCKKKKTPYILYRDTGKGLEEVALGIREFTLTYFDENGSPLSKVPLNAAERAQIRKVAITVKIGDNPDQRWTSEVILKNMG